MPAKFTQALRFVCAFQSRDYHLDPKFIDLNIVTYINMYTSTHSALHATSVSHPHTSLLSSSFWSVLFTISWKIMFSIPLVQACLLLGVIFLESDCAGDQVRPKGAGFLPFVRYDMSAVPPQIQGGDHIYLIFTYSEVAIEGQEDKIVGEGKELKSSCLFRAWRKDGTNSVFQDGDSVLFEHVDTGKYLELTTDTKPLCLAARDENSTGQTFGFFKQGRPMEMKHRDTVYLQSWLHHYVEYQRLGAFLFSKIILCQKIQYDFW